MKINEKMASLAASGQVWYSFEFFPPRTQAGVENLYSRIDRLAALEPLFVDVTWGAGGSTRSLTLDIAEKAQKYCGLDVLMHLTLTGLDVAELKEVLREARQRGIHNILALRGDPVKGAGGWQPMPGGLAHAADLVRLIREEHGDWFCVAVGGHPEGHAEASDRAAEMVHLREKVDAGADFVLTQFFYDCDEFVGYVAAARAAGVRVPIIPGLMPIQNFSAFNVMTSICRTKVPPEIPAALEPIKDDDEQVKAFGVRYAMDMARLLVAAGTPGLHFYTLNLERSVREVVLGLTRDLAEAEAAGQPVVVSGAAERRQFPWRASALAERRMEDVRPINWANRPKSYLQRTEDWDEFPNGRWGDGRSPAFGDLTELYFFNGMLGETDRKAMWGDAPQSVGEIAAVFEAYVRGQIPKLPWCEVELQAETGVITDALVAVNRLGFMTINSQPAVNGARSDHPVFGWGGKGGRVYQKAYVECFCSPESLGRLRAAAERDPHINYCAVNKDGEVLSHGVSGVTALTWGAFPSREVQQPTIFDPQVFLVWAKEAFSLWTDTWASLYDDDSQSSELLYDIHDNYYLVAVVDNDFVHGSTDDGIQLTEAGQAKGPIWQLFRTLAADA